jgi:hypothetical protein
MGSDGMETSAKRDLGGSEHEWRSAGSKRVSRVHQRELTVSERGGRWFAKHSLGLARLAASRIRPLAFSLPQHGGEELRGGLLAPLLLSWNQTQSKLAVQPEAAGRVVLIGPCGRAAVHGMPAFISAVGCLKRLTVLTGWLVEGRQGMR